MIVDKDAHVQARVSLKKTWIETRITRHVDEITRVMIFRDRKMQGGGGKIHRVCIIIARIDRESIPLLHGRVALEQRRGGVSPLSPPHARVNGKAKAKRG